MTLVAHLDTALAFSRKEIMPEIEEVSKEEADDPDDPETSKDKKWKGREEWVRGFDHVVPIDHTHGKYKGPIEKLVELLEKEGYDANERDVGGLTPLMKAAARGYVEAIDCLLDHGAEIDLKDNCGFTALHKAWKEHPEAKEKLIARGATVLPWPKKRMFHYKFRSTGEESFWEWIDDPDAPEDLPKQELPEDKSSNDDTVVGQLKSKTWAEMDAEQEKNSYKPPEVEAEVS